MEDSAHLHVYPLYPDGDQVIPAQAPLLSFREGILRLVCSLRCPALFPSQATELFLAVCSSQDPRLCSSRCSGGKLGPIPAPLVYLQVSGSPSLTLAPAYSSPLWFPCPSAIQSGQSMSHPLLTPAVGFSPPTCSPRCSHKLTWSDTPLPSSPLCSAILSPDFLLHRGGRWPATT